MTIIYTTRCASKALPSYNNIKWQTSFIPLFIFSTNNFSLFTDEYQLNRFYLLGVLPYVWCTHKYTDVPKYIEKPLEREKFMKDKRKIYVSGRYTWNKHTTNKEVPCADLCTICTHYCCGNRVRMDALREIYLSKE